MLRLDPSDGSVAHLVVNPVGTSLRPVQVTIQIPYDVLQVQTISCPDIDGTKPRFGALDPKGNAICLPLVSPKCQYPGIQYAYGIDAGTGAILCKNIPNIKISCPDSKYMSVLRLVNRSGRRCLHHSAVALRVRLLRRPETVADAAPETHISGGPDSCRAKSYANADTTVGF